MERDAVAREQQPHRPPLKTTAGLSDGTKRRQRLVLIFPKLLQG